MTDFDALTHAEQLGILLEIAETATANYDLPPGVSVAMINLSENATYKVEASDGRRWAPVSYTHLTLPTIYSV